MGGILTDKDMDQLEQWIGAGPKTFTLLYKITTDGCKAATFHQKCNNQGPTVTVLYNQQKTVYGGYTSQSWTSREDYVQDDQAFLFRLHFNGKPNPVKMSRRGNGNDVYDVNSYGPTFGGGHDLHTFSSTVNNSGGYFTLNGHVSIGNSYQGLQANQINNGNMNVTDLEVYKVTDGERDLLYSAWRQVPVLDQQLIDQLMDEVTSFEVDRKLNINQAKILMTGPVGVGKSSFYNTMNSILRGRVTQKAFSGSAEESLTTQYSQYVFRTRSGTKLGFRMCDTRGLEEAQGLDSVEYNYLLDGHIPNHYEFNPKKPITPGKQGFISSPKRDDKIHMVVFVLDASKMDVLPSKLVDKIKDFQTIGRQKGIPQILVLTHVDKICAEATGNLSVIFRSKTVEKTVVKSAETFGLPKSSVLPMKNYENEMELQTDISCLALLSLRQILNFTEDYLENMLDELEEDENSLAEEDDD